jgi:N-acyl amino acid synthase of PEP-CTERM/exosortase system
LFINIIDGFNRYFEWVPATSEALKKEVYKLRYQVYCLEIKGLDSACYPDGLEYDDYDQHSVHYLIRHRASGEYAATTRLILPSINHPDRLFQLEAYCGINACAAVGNHIDRQHLGEASRFCVSKAFKKRKNEPDTIAAIVNAPNIIPHEERRTFPHLTLALFACLVRASCKHNIHYWYALLEVPLIRFFSSLGIHFVRIGPPVIIYGERWPCVIKVSDLLNGVAEKNSDVWDMFTNKGQFWDD